MSVDTAEDPSALIHDASRLRDHDTDGGVYVPISHPGGANDEEIPKTGSTISRLCKSEPRTSFGHRGGHGVPGSEHKAARSGAKSSNQKPLDCTFAP